MHRHAGWHAYQEVKGFCYDYQNGQQGFGVTDINFTELWPRKDKYNKKRGGESTQYTYRISLINLKGFYGNQNVSWSYGESLLLKSRWIGL